MNKEIYSLEHSKHITEMAKALQSYENQLVGEDSLTDDEKARMMHWFNFPIDLNEKDNILYIEGNFMTAAIVWKN